jgi:hypothetical protein
VAQASELDVLAGQAEQTLTGIRAQRDELRERDDRLSTEEQALGAALEAMRARIPAPTPAPTRRQTRRTPAAARSRSRTSSDNASDDNGPQEAGKRGGRRAAGDTRLNRRDEMLDLLRSKPRTKRELQDALSVGPTRVRELIQELRDHDVTVTETTAPGPQRVKQFAVA